MKSRWNDAEARRCEELYAPRFGRDLALRTYTSRLIGQDGDLVLHGGGNTSVKTLRRNLLGEDQEVICVKGSGWDLATIEPPGLPALDLAYLRRLRALDQLSDEQMVNELRTHLLEASAPTPSVETLLHAFLPHKFVDHTHADAVCVLTNQKDGAARVRAVLGNHVVCLPWIMPGFPLAKAVAHAFEQERGCRAIVLLHHGIFTFADDARDAYETMIELVSRAEAALRPTRPIAGGIALDTARARAATLAPILRGALALSGPDRHRPYRPLVCEWRATPEVLAAAADPGARALLAQGPLTPDHVLRTRPWYLTLDAGVDRARIQAALAVQVTRYQEFVAQGERARARQVKPLDPHPRVVLAADAGLFAFGWTRKDARIAADIAEHTIHGKLLSLALGPYLALPDVDLFDMEYWSLEQAKLGKEPPRPLAGQVALITGAAGAIGVGIAEALVDAGAHVVLGDLDSARLRAALERVQRKGRTLVEAVTMDVTDAASVRAAFAYACRAFGGVDIVVPNAGIAAVGGIDELSLERWRQVVAVNLDGTFLVLQEAARLFQQQGIGGHVIVNASKNVFDPGARFGAYSASKAGAHQLGKVAALELAEHGVRVNLINADAVFGDDETPSGLWAEVGPDRMKARGLDPDGLREYYRNRNLLKVDVRPEHVGNAVVFFATAATPTTGATLPVDGGIPGAFPR